MPLDPKTPQLNLNQPSIRLTQPQGTFLSNPASAANGSLAIQGPNLPPAPQLALNAAQQGLPQAPQIATNTIPVAGSTPMGGTPMTPMGGTPGQNSFKNWVIRLFTPDYPLAKAIVDSPLGQFISSDKPTGAFNSPPSAAESNSLVSLGYGEGATPSEMHLNVVKQIFPNLTTEQIQQVMVAKGYAFQPSLGGGTWKLVNPNAAQGSGVNLTSYGNTFSGNPTDLARGERVQVTPGYNIVGGTPTTKDIGNTPAGTGQYAITVGTVNQKLDAKGAYKWESYTQKDSNGNWVRVYKKVLRGPYSKGGQQQQEMKQEGRPTTDPRFIKERALGSNTNQLVTLRANFG